MDKTVFLFKKKTTLVVNNERGSFETVDDNYVIISVPAHVSALTLACAGTLVTKLSYKIQVIDSFGLKCVEKLYRALIVVDSF